MPCDHSVPPGRRQGCPGLSRPPARRRACRRRRAPEPSPRPFGGRAHRGAAGHAAADHGARQPGARNGGSPHPDRRPGRVSPGRSPRAQHRVQAPARPTRWPPTRRSSWSSRTPTRGVPHALGSDAQGPDAGALDTTSEIITGPEMPRCSSRPSRPARHLHRPSAPAPPGHGREARLKRRTKEKAAARIGSAAGGAAAEPGLGHLRGVQQLVEPVRRDAVLRRQIADRPPGLEPSLASAAAAS